MNYPEFSFYTRKQKLEELTAQIGIFDAIIIGGGIVGAGLARELTIRGLHTLLVEKNDFASGTSSRSSKLIHGGLRYLEMKDFHLVFESLKERHWLLKTHPHLVKPLEFTLPLFKKKHAPIYSRPGFLLSVGLWVYDLLGLLHAPFFHGKRNKLETLKFIPGLREIGLRGSFYYADAMMLDDEIVLEVILDAYRRGAFTLNYVKAEHVSHKGNDDLYTVRLSDQLTGISDSFYAKARQVIVCVGPWTEKFGNVVSQGADRKLKPSKGIHFILPWEKLPVENCLVMYASDGRFVFVIPRKDLGSGAELVIVGTTDSPKIGDLENLQATSKEISYLITVLKEYFPKKNISESDILMTYAGVRPLLDDGSKSEAQTSREHEIWRNNAGIVFMAGGKYTTFRKISQEIADFAFPQSKKRDKASKEPLSMPQDYQNRLRGAPLWGRYTDEWVQWKLEHHAPCTLEDVVFRRLPVWMVGRELKDDVLEKIIEICAHYFQWTDAQVVIEKAAVEKQLKRGICANTEAVKTTAF